MNDTTKAEWISGTHRNMLIVGFVSQTEIEGLDGGRGGGYKCQLSVKILAICQLSVKF